MESLKELINRCVAIRIVMELGNVDDKKKGFDLYYENVQAIANLCDDEILKCGILTAIENKKTLMINIITGNVLHASQENLNELQKMQDIINQLFNEEQAEDINSKDAYKEDSKDVLNKCDPSGREAVIKMFENIDDIDDINEYISKNLNVDENGIILNEMTDEEIIMLSDKQNECMRREEELLAEKLSTHKKSPSEYENDNMTNQLYEYIEKNGTDSILEGKNIGKYNKLKSVEKKKKFLRDNEVIPYSKYLQKFKKAA